MKRAVISMAIVLALCGVLIGVFWTRLTVRESGHGFPVENYIVMGEYGYSDGGDRLRYAIFRTWPKDSTTAERELDPRVGRDFLMWPLIRDRDGRMIPAGADGDVYFFEGDNLKTLKVRMNEHTDTMALDDCKTLKEVWAYLQRFRIDNLE